MIDVETTLRSILADLHPAQLFPERLAIDARRIEVDGLTVDLDGLRGVTILGLGKAAVPQVRTLRDMLARVLPPGVELPRGFAVTKTGHGESSDDCAVLVGSHPIPDPTSRSAAAELLWRAKSTPADHLLVVCLSGGGSALATSPRDPFRMREKLHANLELLQGGASIDETNLIRREMSSFKNGALLAASGARRVLTLVTSDVPVEDLGVVASGPTIHRKLDPGLVREVAAARLPRVLSRRIDAQLNGSQRRAWNAHLEAAAAEHRSLIACVGDYRTLAEVSRRRLAADGYSAVRVADAPYDMGIEEGIALHVRELERTARTDARWALVTGGELPVRVRGDGRGGRCTEFVVRMAKALWLDRCGEIPDAVRDSIVVSAVGTDGSDGPTGAAGGWLTRTDLETARSKGLSIDAAIDASDTLTFLDALGRAIRTGPTHTNLMDLRLITTATGP